MRRVAITGIGIVSSIGNNVSEVTTSLRNGTSGIVAAPEYTELGFRSQVHGTVKLDVADHVDRKQLRFMGEGAAYAVLAMEQAIADAGLDDPASVACVQMKCPQSAQSADSPARSRGASALGAALALGEVTDEALTEAAIGHDTGLFTERGSASSG